MDVKNLFRQELRAATDKKEKPDPSDLGTKTRADAEAFRPVLAALYELKEDLAVATDINIVAVESGVYINLGERKLIWAFASAGTTKLTGDYLYFVARVIVTDGNSTEHSFDRADDLIAFLVKELAKHVASWQWESADLAKSPTRS